MDRQGLKRRLRDKVEAALDRAMDAVQSAPDGQWIAGSEWAVRGAFQELMRDCFQEIIQEKVVPNILAIKLRWFHRVARVPLIKEEVESLFLIEHAARKPDRFKAVFYGVHCALKKL